MARPRTTYRVIYERDGQPVQVATGLITKERAESWKRKHGWAWPGRNLKVEPEGSSTLKQFMPVR